MLKTETATPAMEQRIREAFAAWLDHGRPLAGRYQFDFEHAQWWVTCLDTGTQWSVVDAEGGDSVDGFDFELISEGEE